MQAPPLALVHEVFGEFLTNAVGIQPSPDTYEFVLEACAMLANFFDDEKYRQRIFNGLLGRYLGKDIYRVHVAKGVSTTGGSIVDEIDMPEVSILLCHENSVLVVLFETFLKACVLFMLDSTSFACKTVHIDILHV